MRRFARGDRDESGGNFAAPADDREVNTGLSRDELCGTVFNAYRNAKEGLGLPVPPWHEIGEGHQEGWAKVIRELEPVIVEADGLSWLSLARLAHTAFGGHEKPYEEEADGEKLCWVAAVRHLANMLDWEQEDEKSVESHEMHWRPWIKNQIEMRQVAAS